MRQHVQVLVGPIASGKGTYAKNAATEGFVTINDDSIVNAVHGGQYHLYDKSLKPLYKSVENQMLTAAIGLGRSVVVDRGTNGSRDSRRRWVGLAHSLDVPVVAVEFQDEGVEVHAERRARTDGRGYGVDYWRRVAQAHADRFDKVHGGDGFDVRYEVDWAEIESGVVVRPTDADFAGFQKRLQGVK